MWGDRRRAGRKPAVRALFATALLVGGLVVAFAGPAQADGTPPPEAYILVDAGTGAVITGRNIHEALPTASIAKIMTALVAVERLPPNATISVGPDAASREAMRIGMQTGQHWPFYQAMASMMMVSANDAAYAIAETVGGSIPGFAADLNATAKRFGMRDSTFGDPAGLTDSTSYNGGPHVSAYDMAIATRNALTVPQIAKWADTRTYDFTDSIGVHHELTNHDKFLPDNGFGYPGANGFKTGYTDIADHTLVATAKRNGRQCIAVILGSSDSGYTWAASLLDQCWVSPPVATTGVVLPPVAVSPYGTRVDERAGFVRDATGTDAGATLGAPAAATATTAAPHVDTAAASASTTSAHATKPHHKSGGLLTLTNVVIVAFLALVGCVFLRRRAVKRQRARRNQRRRARAKAMRSGSLPVVDGRYRTGKRVGPPIESHVRIERTYIDLTREDERDREWR